MLLNELFESRLTPGRKMPIAIKPVTKITDPDLKEAISNFKDYDITEDKTLLYYLSLITIECKQALHEMKLANSFLYRGIRDPDLETFVGLPWNTRFPKDSDPETQKGIDNVLELAGFGALRRNSIFCFGFESTAYGKPYIIFPVNGYQVTWSKKINDLYVDISYIKDFYTKYIVAQPNVKQLFAQLLPAIDEIIEKSRNLKMFSMTVPLNMLKTRIHNPEHFRFNHTLQIIFQNIRRLKPDVRNAIVTSEQIQLLNQLNDIFVKFSVTPDNVKDIAAENGFSNTDLHKAIQSENEIYIHGKYYGFEAQKYRTLFTKCFLTS